MRWQGLENRVSGDRTISRFAQRTTFRCLIEVDTAAWIIAMTDGVMTPPAQGPFVMPHCDFALSGSAFAWERLSVVRVAPGDQDLFAFFRRGEIALTGDTRKFYAHLFVLKMILAHLRDSE